MGQTAPEAAMEHGVSTVNSTPATDRNQSSTSSQRRSPKADRQQLEDLNGMLALAQVGLNARDEKTIKNRIIGGLFAVLLVSMVGNVVQYNYRPEPALLEATPDGRYKKLPLLSDPIYSHKEILAWSQRCVEGIYRLSWVDWKTSISNNNFCLSDSNRNSFKSSLEKIGVMRYLTAELQGNIYAKTMQPIMRTYSMNERGYYEWIVDVPYTIYIDGRERGTLSVVMTMKIRRKSMLLRDDGLWVESYRVSQAEGRRQ